MKTLTDGLGDRFIEPELYDLVHRGNPGDLEHYLSLCKNSADVLELGCGSGRVGLPICGAGSNLVGLDQDKRFLDRLVVARESSGKPGFGTVTVVEGDMGDFRIPKKFDRVIIPFNGLLCLLGDDIVTSCLRCAGKHLKKGGLVGFDIYAIFRDMVEGEEDDREELDALEPVAEFYGEGRRIEVHERSVSTSDPHRFDAGYLFKITEEDGTTRVVSHIIEQRAILVEDIEVLLEKAGLRPVSIFGDFAGRPVDRETDQMVVIAAPMD